MKILPGDYTACAREDCTLVGSCLRQVYGPNHRVYSDYAQCGEPAFQFYIRAEKEEGNEIA